MSLHVDANLLSDICYLPFCPCCRIVPGRAYYFHFWSHGGGILAADHTLYNGSQSGDERFNKMWLQRMGHTTRGGCGKRFSSGSVVLAPSTGNQAGSTQPSQPQKMLKFCSDPLSPHSELKNVMAQMSRQHYGSLARHISGAYADVQFGRATYSSSCSSQVLPVQEFLTGLRKSAPHFKIETRAGRAQQQIAVRVQTASKVQALAQAQLLSTEQQQACMAAAEQRSALATQSPVAGMATDPAAVPNSGVGGSSSGPEAAGLSPEAPAAAPSCDAGAVTKRKAANKGGAAGGARRRRKGASTQSATYAISTLQ